MTTPYPDFSPLVAPISREEVAQFRRESRERREPWVPSPLTVVLPIALVAMFAISIAGPVASGNWRSLGVLSLPLVVLGFIVVVTVFSHFDPRRWRRILRRVRFARANHLVYVHEGPAPAYPGMIFTIGNNRRRMASIRRLDPALDIGSYRYTTGSGRNKATWRWGYVAMKLPRRLPHMLLDARGNNSILGSNLPTTFSRSQVLSLEGDFDRYFTLYCPKEYERDALYVFAPDLMALLIDKTADFDVEIVDDWMFLYTRGTLDIDDPVTLGRIFSIVDTIGAKALRQTRRYADERIGNRAVNLVAPQGQRLVKRLHPAHLLWIGAVVLIVGNVVQAVLR